MGRELAPMLMRSAAKNIYLYRLREIERNQKRGLLVVPIS